MKAGKNAIKVLNNNNAIQIRKRTGKKPFTDGHLLNFKQLGHDVKRERGVSGKHATSIVSERKEVS